MAVLLDEAGHDKAAELAQDALISSVNVAEIVAKCIEFAFPEQLALEYIQASNITVVDFDLQHAVLAGELRRRASKGMLSLGDRACIATAIRQGAIAVTADRIWSTLDLGCQIELIR
jgi:PIN domain nuclease of toxin-antitoxin system